MKNNVYDTETLSANNLYPWIIIYELVSGNADIKENSTVDLGDDKPSWRYLSISVNCWEVQISQKTE